MDVRLEQKANDDCPMLVTESVIKMLAREVQLKNASSQMRVTVEGKAIDFRLVHSSKRCGEMCLI